MEGGIKETWEYGETSLGHNKEQLCEIEKDTQMNSDVIEIIFIVNISWVLTNW